MSLLACIGLSGVREAVKIVINKLHQNISALVWPVMRHDRISSFLILPEKWCRTVQESANVAVRDQSDEDMLRFQQETFMKVALNDLKKRKKIKLVSNMAETTKNPISSTIFWAFNVLM